MPQPSPKVLKAMDWSSHSSTIKVAWDGIGLLAVLASSAMDKAACVVNLQEKAGDWEAAATTSATVR